MKKKKKKRDNDERRLRARFYARVENSDKKYSGDHLADFNICLIGNYLALMIDSKGPKVIIGGEGAADGFSGELWGCENTLFFKLICRISNIVQIRTPTKKNA